MILRAQMPPVLVLGATSLIGQFLTARLTQARVAYLEVSRRASQRDQHWLQADLADPDLASKLPALDTVYSLSPIWLLPAALPALQAAGMKRLIAFSSTSRFTKLDSSEASERDVARALAAGEAQVEAFCQAHGIDWIILRPTLIYAEGQDGNVSRLAAMIRRFSFLPISGRGEGLRQPVHADDLAAGAIAAASSPAARGKAYNLPGGETLTYRQMVARIFESLSKPVSILALPPWLWRAAFVLARPLLGRATAAMGMRMAHDLAFDGTPAARDFGWTARGFRPRF